jgi:DNA-binding transcriptional MerR regulator
MAIYSIGQLAKKTDCKIPTIRYYEEINIIPPAPRSSGNQRRYNDTHLKSLNFVKHCRGLGFSIEEVRQLVHLQTCEQHRPDEAHHIAIKHLQEVQQKIKQLQQLEHELQTVVGCCSDEHACKTLERLNKTSVAR